MLPECHLALVELTNELLIHQSKVIVIPWKSKVVRLYSRPLGSLQSFHSPLFHEKQLPYIWEYSLKSIMYHVDIGFPVCRGCHAYVSDIVAASYNSLPLVRMFKSLVCRTN